ncbi:MAG: hypothetical protein NTV22_02870, partial [bacterium]|nr:hypothetical protein [bacterium]
TNDVVLRAINVGNPAVNEASVTFAYDEYGTPLPNQNYVTGVVVQAASIRGTVYNDLNTNGVYNPGDVGLPNVDITLYTDPLGDGSASNGTLAGGPAQSMTDGSYQFLNLSTGRYVVVETQPLGYVSSSPNRLPVNVTNLADYLNRDFFDYEPPPNTFSTLGGTVYNDFNGNGQRDDGATAVLANVQIDLVEDVNSNGVIDVGEQTTQNAWSGSNGRFQLGAVPVGSWIIFEHDAPGFISTSSNALPVTATAGSTQTNFYFLDHYLPPLVDLTNTNFTVDYEVTSITVAGTNNPTVVGGMWVTNTAGNGSVSTFPAATAWATPLVDVATGVNVIVVYGMNALGVLVSDTVTVTRLLPETALRLTKTASPSSVEPGAQLVYQITVSNASSLAVEHVTVTDTYPARFSADVAQPAGGPSWDLGSLAARTAKTVIIGGYVSTGALAGIRLTNTAAAIVCGPAISTNVITPVIAPTNWPAELVLALSAVPPSATNGQTVVFTLTIGNPGTEAASNVTAAAALPPGLTPVGATSWALGTLPVGATISIVFTGTVSSATVGTILVVPASVTAANAEPKATWVEVKVDPAAGLARLVRVTKTASQTVARPGQTIAYVITVSNAGPAVATNVVVTETFPPLFVFVESAPLASGLGGNEWSFSTLAAGAARQILISGYVVTNATVGERLRNTVVAVATNSVSTNATVEVLVTNPPPATAPLLDLTMLDSADPVTNGQLLIYSLRVQNTGSGWASNVVFNLNFDAKYSVSSLLATNIGTLAPGSEAFLVITGTVVNATAGDVLEQIATVFSSNGQPDTASEQTRVVAILPPQLLVITKTASPDNPMAGGNIVYTIIARNTSAMTATNVTVRENFDGYVTCTNATPAASRQPPPEWEWSLGFIAAGVARTITVVGVVATNVTPGANLRNNVEAWGDNSRKVETNIVNGVIITPFIRITSPGPGLVLPFNVLSCQITGISTGLVGQVVYSNSWTSPGVSGMTAGTLAAASAWSVALHLPHYGSYTFSIVGTNVFGNPVSDSVSFTRNRYNVYLLRNP